MRLVRRVRHFADVQLRQQYENERLNQSHEHAQRHQQNRRGPGPRRRESGERFQYLLVGKQVTEETNAERERTNQITNQLDREDQRRDPPNGTSKVGQVTTDSILFDTDVVVVKKRSETERERNARCRSRTHEERKESH